MTRKLVAAPAAWKGGLHEGAMDLVEQTLAGTTVENR